MTIYAGFQRQAMNPVTCLLGVMTKGAIMGDTIGVVCLEPVEVAKPMFIVDYNPDLNVSGQGTNPDGSLQFAGVVTRSNTTSSETFYTLGYSRTIPKGETAQVMQRGTIPVIITKANEAGAVPKINSVVWAMNDGTFQTQVSGTAVANGQATNLRVQRLGTTPFVAGQTPVIITNVQNMGV